MTAKPAGKVALITGASSGIGADLAQELARRGWKVGLFARRADELAALASEIEKAGGQALALPGDATRREDIEGAVQKVTAHWGQIDTLVANAGVGAYRKSWEKGGQSSENTIRVNLLGVMYAVDAVIESMVQRGGGQIVAVSSLAGWRGLPQGAAYSASKAGVSAYLETLRVDLAGKGIQVTTIHPGFVRTPLTSKNKKMPFLVESADAARIMADGIEARRKEVNFPLPLVAAMRLVRVLPNFLYDRLIKLGA